jgi:hypothetical protein
VLDIGEQLNVNRNTLYAHIGKLGLHPRRFPPGNTLYLTPDQATALTESVRHSNVGPSRPIPIDGDRAATLIRSLNEGKSVLDLVLEHKATFIEAEGTWKWWVTHTHGLYLSQQDLAQLSRLLNGTVIADNKALLALVHLRGCCRQCSTPSLYCASCLPYTRSNGHGRVQPSPEVPAVTATHPVVDDDRIAAEEAAFQARQAEARRRAGLPPEKL